MGTVGPDDYRDDAVAAAMVAEGARSLCDSEYPVLGGLSVAEVARRVGVTERTGYAKWDAQDFRVAVLRRVLRGEETPQDLLEPAEMVDVGRRLVDDEAVAPLDDLVELFDSLWKAAADSAEHRVVNALWAYCDGDTRLAEEMRTEIGRRYERWLREIQTVLDAFLAEHSGRVTVRDDLSRSDMVLFAMALNESAAYHARLGRLLGKESFSPDTPGRILKAMLASALVFHEDDGPHPVDTYLDRLLTPPNPKPSPAK